MPVPSDAIDQQLMICAGNRWQKVAMIIVRAHLTLEPDYPEFTYEAIAERLYTLVAANNLEGAGELTRWRHSEVRLPQ